MIYPCRARGAGGFTLLELLAVLVIAGMSLALVVGSSYRSYRSSVLKQEARTLQRTLKYAREQAMLRRRPVTFTVGESSYGMLYAGDGAGAALTARNRRLPVELTLEGEDIVFMPKGDNTGGSLTLRHTSGKGYSIEVDPTTGGAALRGF